jgi:hypothetical protein
VTTMTGLTWLSDTAKPTKKALEALWADVQAEIADEAKPAWMLKLVLSLNLQALGLTVDEVSGCVRVGGVVSTMRFDDWQTADGTPITDKDDAQTDFGG